MTEESVTLRVKIKNLWRAIRKLPLFDLSDGLGLLALVMIFNGFYLWIPFVAWIVTGFLLLIFAALISKKRD